MIIIMIIVLRMNSSGREKPDARRPKIILTIIIVIMIIIPTIIMLVIIVIRADCVIARYAVFLYCILNILYHVIGNPSVRPRRRAAAVLHVVYVYAAV